jgi:hypothetical protein
MAIVKPSVAEVRQVITTALPDSTVSVVIDHAALVVEACVESLAEDRQKAIVTYVAADFIASAVSTGGKGAKVSSALGDASDSWAANLAGAEFGKSAYWSRALLLDPNGCLHKLGRRRAILETV